MADDPMSVGEAREHIVTFQAGIGPQEIVHAVPGRQHPENVLDRKAAASKGWLPTEDFRVHGDPFEQQSFRHVSSGTWMIAVRRATLPVTSRHPHGA